MTNATTTQQNMGFIKIPYAILGGEASIAEITFEGVIYSWFSSLNKAFKAGYAYLCEKTGLSRSTLSRTVKRLIERKEISIERKGQACTQYTYERELPKNAAHIRLEYAFCTCEFKIIEKIDGNFVKHFRRLKGTERSVLALIYTHTWDRKRPFIATHKKIAAMLGCAEETVCRAISVLTASHLIEHKIERYNKRELQEHHFYVIMRTLRKYGITRRDLREERKAAQKEKEEQQRLPKHVQDANAASDRRRFYDLRKNYAVNEADKWLNRAKKNARFSEVNTELKKLEIAIAKAELFEPTKIPLLQSTKEGLLKERRAILGWLGIDESLLEKETHCKCKKCIDTGFLPDGTSCDCYKPGEKP